MLARFPTGFTPTRRRLAHLVVAGCLAMAACGPESGPAFSDADSRSDTTDGRDVGLETDGGETGGPRPRTRFEAGPDHLRVLREGSFEPIFVKGINLGVAVPGTLAGELAASREQYDRWLDQIRETGFNAIRVYTLHYPRFYEELREHNRQHPDDPLYLLQGIWITADNPTGNLFELSQTFDDNIREVVDCIHGNRTIDPRYGEAFGEFRADVSRWVLGYIIGREFTPNEVMATNGSRSNLSSFDGTYFSVPDGDPVEVWLAKRLETVTKYEWNTYSVERPVSVSSWPTLDPVDHPTEHERYSSEDIADFDLSNVEPEETEAGLFASYHAYPYYPNFMSEDPGYRMYSDKDGPNGYLGYLFDLKNHHDEMPVLIAEFGVPSSWVNAHSGYEGMNHGGHTEREQGRAVARMFNNHLEANLAGGALFEWIDEGWKPTWITNPRDFPFKRRRLWHSVAAPEQNFGLVSFDLGTPSFERADPISGKGAIPEARATTDTAYFHVRLRTNRPLKSDDRLVVGFDTYGDNLGESELPDGVQTSRRNEYALVVEGRSEAKLMVMEEYRMVGIWYQNGMGHRSFRSVKSDDGEWRLVQFQNSQPHGTPDGKYWFDATFDDAGDLRIRSADDEKTNLDAVVVRDDRIDIRIPWTYLGVTDPSRRRVMHDDPMTDDRETRKTAGISVSVAWNGNLLFESDRINWSTWEEGPETTERTKRSLPVVRRALDSLPDWLGSSQN